MMVGHKKWKLAFLILLAVNLVIVIGLTVLIFLPSSKVNHISSSETNAVGLDVATNKEDLTKIINYYIEKEGLDGPVHYEINLSDEVELYGYLPVFGQDIDLKLTFEPEALENGNLLLRQKSISIGKLPLPVSYVMKFIQQQYKLPGWVEINPNDETVYMHLTEMKIANGLSVNMQEFDLLEDKIQLKLILPTK
ncbi:YpmS family protein [Niallia sp. NCCP-28]|uniref:YpmS family protein n=1 Tax=Niallia sp. NCCP-28 TaxID=2934712 RepID=UPI0020C02DB4|nr:YpmS family protein [Niallia sp. NCCP-28]